MGVISKPKTEASFQIEQELIDLLGQLNLDHLSPVFADNEVTIRDLQKLQPSDLQDIGI